MVWKTDRRWGFLFAFFCAVAWWLAQIGSNPYQTQPGLAIAGRDRFFYFAVVAVAAGGRENAARDGCRRRIADLERTQKLERDILQASEREQQRIGRDLHDNLGPHLAAIGYAATFLENELRASAQPAAAKAEQIREMAGTAVALTRDLARGLVPVRMDGPGLSIALEDLARTTSSVTPGWRSLFTRQATPQSGNPEDGLHLYRIAQEAVNNAAKHGGASKVTIALSQDEDALRLAVADDGKGMTLAAERSGRDGNPLDAISGAHPRRRVAD